jgi:hypothetical protein
LQKGDFFPQVEVKTKLGIYIHTTNQLHGAEFLLKTYQLLSQPQNSPPFMES